MKTGGYNSSVSAPGTKYIWYYLLLKASRRGSIWFQWGLAFIPSSSWTELCSPGRMAHLPRWHNELVTLSRLDLRSLLAPRTPRTSSMTNREFSTSCCFDFKWLLQLWVLLVFVFSESQRINSSSLCYISTVGRLDIYLFSVNDKAPASLPLDLFIQAQW